MVMIPYYIEILLGIAIVVILMLLSVGITIDYPSETKEKPATMKIYGQGDTVENSKVFGEKDNAD